MEDNEKQTNKQTYKYKTNHLNTYYSVVQQLCSMGGGGTGISMLLPNGIAKQSERGEGEVPWSSGCYGINVLWQDIKLHLPISIHVLKGYPVGCER